MPKRPPARPATAVGTGRPRQRRPASSRIDLQVSEGTTRERHIVDPRQIGHLRPQHVYGGFVEHLGRCIYGGILMRGHRSATSVVSAPTCWTCQTDEDKRSALAWRELRLELPLAATGWPKGRPPTRAEIAWGGLESNRFGTNEFIELLPPVLGQNPISA